MHRRSLFTTIAAVTLLLGLIAGTVMAARPVWTFSVALEGAQEVGGGDADAMSRAIVQIRPDAGTVCFNVGWRGIEGDVWGAHIHENVAGMNGPIVVGFFGGPPPENFTAFSGDRFRVMDCVTADSALLWEIVSNPSGFYVNVHSFVFNGGAVRGQLE